MKKIKSLLSIALAGVMTLAMAGCNLVEKSPEAIQKTVLAKVGSAKITKGDLDEELAPVLTSLVSQFGEDYMSDETGAAYFQYYQSLYLNRMITEEVLLQMADKLGIVPEEEELNKQTQAKLEEIKGLYDSEEKYQADLTASGLNDETVVDYVKKQVIMSLLIESILKDVTVSDEEVTAYYEEHKGDYVKQAAGAKMYHILVATEDEAKKVKEEYDNGASFSDLAAKYGTDGTKDKGGELGFVAYDATNFDSDFLAGAKTLAEGEVSNPVKTQFGYHIIKVDGVISEATYETFDEVKDEVKAAALEAKKDKVYADNLEKWQEELDVVVYDDKLTELNEK